MQHHPDVPLYNEGIRHAPRGSSHLKHSIVVERSTHMRQDPEQRSAWRACATLAFIQPRLSTLQIQESKNTPRGFQTMRILTGKVLQIWKSLDVLLLQVVVVQDSKYVRGLFIDLASDRPISQQLRLHLADFEFFACKLRPTIPSLLLSTSCVPCALLVALNVG